MSNERVQASVLDDLYEMASTCAVKGKLLRELIDEIRDTRKLLEGARAALEAGAVACEFKANHGSKQHAATLRSLAGVP